MSDTRKTYTTDVLVIGGGLGGIILAEKLHMLKPDVKITIMEKGYFGYTGQTTKAGHGMCMLSPEAGDDIYEMCKEQVEHNPYGTYLNDQEYMLEYQKEQYTYIQELERMGGKFSHNPDGTLHHHHEFEGKKISAVQIDVDFMTAFAEQVLAGGGQILERTYFTDLLTNKGNVVGAVGFHLDTTEFIVVRAKEVVLAANEFNPSVRDMFYAPATAYAAAYEAGAQLRNVEHLTEWDLCYRNTGNFLYGVHWVVCNQKGENLFQKYHSQSYEELDVKLIRGMAKELEEGNGPLIADFTQLQKANDGADGFYHGIEMKQRLELDEFIRSFQNIDMADPKPEVSVSYRVSIRSLRIDVEGKTTVPHLWGIGQMTTAGSAHGSWVHGDGLGVAAKTGLMTARALARRIDDTELGEIDEDQVEYFRGRIFEAAEYTGEFRPDHVIRYLSRLIKKPEYSFNKTEETMTELLEEIANVREQYKDLIHLPKVNGHYLSKAIELRTMIDMLEVMFTVFKIRKESRGCFSRLDYPERDDKNWLKWILVNRGNDGKPSITFERIPIERYPFQPEGWKEIQIAE
ncbi:MAG: FAD-binding protein [Eubacterium sp.]|jgi:succinate dehydrogenase / fumarate reductase flavoprotein subunit